MHTSLWRSLPAFGAVTAGAALAGYATANYQNEGKRAQTSKDTSKGGEMPERQGPFPKVKNASSDENRLKTDLKSLYNQGRDSENRGSNGVGPTAMLKDRWVRALEKSNTQTQSRLDSYSAMRGKVPWDNNWDHRDPGIASHEINLRNTYNLQFLL